MVDTLTHLACLLNRENNDQPEDVREYPIFRQTQITRTWPLYYYYVYIHIYIYIIFYYIYIYIHILYVLETKSASNKLLFSMGMWPTSPVAAKAYRGSLVPQGLVEGNIFTGNTRFAHEIWGFPVVSSSRKIHFYVADSMDIRPDMRRICMAIGF